MDELRILVAEGNEAIRRRIIRILGWDFRVIAAVSNHAELRRAALVLQPDVIVCSTSVARQGSIAALKDLKSDGKALSFVFVTTEKDSAEWVEEFPAGLVHKLDLPQDLNAAVRSIADGSVFLSRSCKRRMH